MDPTDVFGSLWKVLSNVKEDEMNALSFMWGAHRRILTDNDSLDSDFIALTGKPQPPHHPSELLAATTGHRGEVV